MADNRRFVGWACMGLGIALIVGHVALAAVGRSAAVGVLLVIAMILLMFGLALLRGPGSGNQT